jgi:succinate-acetate transporter protein
MFWQIGPSPTSGNPNTISSSFSWAIGGEVILTGLAAWYGATSMLTNATYGRRVLPM